MKTPMLISALAATFVLAACDRPTVVTTTPPTSTVAVPVPVPVPVPGPPGAPGEPGKPGSPGAPGTPGASGDTNVIVVQPPASAPK